MGQQLQRCLVVGGAGAVGSMFGTLLASAGAEVRVIDIKLPVTPVQFEQGDITAPTSRMRAAINKADLVLLAVPERIALAAIVSVAAEMKQEALLAHTLSVQSPIAAVVRAAGLNREVVGLNPMFAPTLSIVGRPVAAIVLNDGPRASELLQKVSAWGGRVVRLSAEEHDRLTAATQVLTHAVVLAFGLALAHLDVDMALLSTLASPPHGTMLALLARIVSGTPDVYWDIQSANPQAPAAHAALVSGIEQLMMAVKDEAAFVASMQEGRKTLGDELDWYRDACTRIFNALPIRPLPAL